MATQFGKNSTLVSSQGDKDKILFFAAVLLALSLAIIFIIFVKSRRPENVNQAQVAGQPIQATPISPGTVTLYAPKSKIPAGTLLEGLQFEEKYWPRNQIPDGAVRDISELTGMYARSDLESGYPIQRTALTKDQMGYSIPLQAGMRAVTLEIDDTAGVEGWATPGKRVDLVLSSRENSDMTARIIVQNAKILSLGGQSSTTREQNPDSRTATRRLGRTTITLEVNIEDALKVEAAKGVGRLSMLLRNDADTAAAATTEYKTSEFPSEDDKNKAKPATKCDPGVIKLGGLNYQMCAGKLVLIDSSEVP